MKDDLQEKINSLSMIEQNVQQLSVQRQTFQAQLLEIESAMNELQDSKQSYKIIGNIMVRTEPEKMKEELSEKSKIIQVRVSSIEKQEKSLKEKSKKIQEEVVAGLEKKEDKNNK